MKYTISIAVHNNLAYTKACLQSILAGNEDFELVVTDNGSSDQSWAYLLELSLKKVRLTTVLNPANEGFIRAHNAALHLAHGEFFVALNNDTEVSSGWLDRMASEFEKNPKLALCGIKGGYSSIDAEGRTHITQELEYVEGSCLMAPRTLALSHGLFSEEYEFGYWEDVDLSLRMRKAGFNITVVDIPFLHHRETTAKIVKNIDLRGIQERNHATFIKKWEHYLKTKTFNV